MTELAIEARGLRKAYAGHETVRGIDLQECELEWAATCLPSRSGRGRAALRARRFRWEPQAAAA